jgi:hypothetical protein
MRKHRLILFFTVLSGALVACGPGVGKNLNPEDPLAQLVPEWTSVSYVKDGQRVELSPPYEVTQQIFADAATGSCTGNTMEIIFSGTFNPEIISRVTLTGLTAEEEVSGSSFKFVTCMAPGSALVKITAFDKDGKPVRSPLSVSLNAMTATKTAGFGHPNYPNTGFAMISAAAPLPAFNTGTVKMINTYMGGVAGKTSASTGKTGYTLETGFTGYLKQATE